jgi:hypothetical protein
MTGTKFVGRKTNWKSLYTEPQGFGQTRDLVRAGQSATCLKRAEVRVSNRLRVLRVLFDDRAQPYAGACSSVPRWVA